MWFGEENYLDEKLAKKREVPETKNTKFDQPGLDLKKRKLTRRSESVSNNHLSKCSQK